MTEIISYGGLALLLAGIPAHLAQRCGASRRVLAVFILVLLGMFLIPWTRHSLVFYVRGIVGDLSVTSLVLLCVLYGRSLIWPARDHQPICGKVGWVLLAILVPLYLSTMGYWTYDVYGLGYEPQWLLLVSALLMLWAWRTQPALAIAWLIGVVSFACGLTPSKNLWDALFDLFMGFAAVGLAVTSVIRALIGKKTTSQMIEVDTLQRAA